MSASDTAIRVENVSKVYRLNQREDPDASFVSSLMTAFRSPLENFRKYQSLYKFDDVDFDHPEACTDPSILWALKNVSFDVKKGEIVGIIGRNGAGKSTLLKIMSKITPPAQGRIEIRGSTSSLLEVGTGFHPELTGRENIYLNGTILGMRKKEVDRKFDEIVDFSDVEKFLDTPVKRYSSGMRVRLAFSVAAHLEPEILIVDEVLAVGDAAFQQKCINKMESVGGTGGRTVFFVSHNMPAVTRLCSRVIMLGAGQLVADGPTHDVVAQYMHEGSGTSSERIWPDIDTAPGGDFARLKSVRIKNEKNETTESIDIRKKVGLEMTFSALEGGSMFMPHFHLVNDDGVRVFTTLDVDPNWRKKRRPKGTYTVTAWVPGNLLSEGSFFVNAAMITVEPQIKQYFERDAVSFRVVDSLEGDSARGDWAKEILGVVRPLLEWETNYSEAL